MRAMFNEPMTSAALVGMLHFQKVQCFFLLVLLNVLLLKEKELLPLQPAGLEGSVANFVAG